MLGIFIFSNVVESVFNPNDGNKETNSNVTKDNDKYLNDNERKTFQATESLKRKGCKLKVDRKSQKEFTHNIMIKKYNFVHLKLHFVNFTVNATRNVIGKDDWIWTYRGENGAQQYLYIPDDFGYLSFGLLWAHTLEERLPIDLISHNCSNLTIGEKETDSLISQALDKMTSKIPSKHAIYNSSYWCYNKRIWIYSRFLYEFCSNWICTLQTIEYECCNFHYDYVTKNRTNQCHKENHNYGAIWWMLPIITGNICFAFYPLLLTKIGMKFKKLSKIMKKERSKSGKYPHTETNQHNQESKERKMKSDYISLNSSNLISVFSTLVFPIYVFVFGGSRGSRFLRIWIIILPMCITAIHALLDYVYAYHFWKDAVRKGAIVGFSAILTRPTETRKQFMYAFGGPIVATAVCFLFGFLLIVFPADLEEFLTIRIGRRSRKYLLYFNLPLKIKERMSGINVRNYKGCKKLHNLFLAQIFMLINFQFWKQSLKLFYLRWKNIIFIKMYKIWQNRFVAILLGIVMLPCYIVFCVIELLFAVLYYLFPVISCFFIILNSTCIHYNNYFKHKAFILKCIQYVFFIPMLILFSASWYTYSIIFLDGFWFLSRIVMLTYGGIVAYPHFSYGYLVLAFMTLFYVTESINAFSESYRDLLKVSLDSCEKFQRKYIDDDGIDKEELKSIKTKYGMKTDIFYWIIDKNLPKRNQLLITLLKMTSVVTILIISVNLLVTFDKFKELSIVEHVFTVLFICALPKILKRMCFQNFKNRTRHKMKQKVFKTIVDYIKTTKRQNSKSYNELEYVFVSESIGYETVPACGVNNGDLNAGENL